MERHLAWLVALIIVLIAWIALLCYGASVRKKPNTHRSNTSSPSTQDRIDGTNTNEQIDGAEPCSCDQTETSRQTSCHEQSKGAASSGEMYCISIHGTDDLAGLATIQDVCAAASTEDTVVAAMSQGLKSEGIEMQDVEEAAAAAGRQVLHNVTKEGANSQDCDVARRPGAEVGGRVLKKLEEWPPQL
ncbi:hypothetical protein L7F22_028246 [Adiantum nelumboides]|nr:hypothetical protein [Adiantum nelumboides]